MKDLVTSIRKTAEVDAAQTEVELAQEKLEQAKKKENRKPKPIDPREGAGTDETPMNATQETGGTILPDEAPMPTKLASIIASGSSITSA